jgi:bacterial/archaeal transporter family protein
VTWLFLTLASAFLLGFYDCLKKLSLRDNAVMPVLFISIGAGAALWLPFMLWSAVAPETLPHAFLFVTGISGREHLLLLVKSILVGSSWVFGYMGVKSLPLSIATPIRATGPLWTILFAVMLYGESPNAKQWLGVTVILVAFLAFTFVGRHEGIRFHRDKGVLHMMLATLLGSASALYDKYLLQQVAIPAGAVQAWFSLYMALLLLPAMVIWMRSKNRHPFEWRWSIPVIGLTLIAADIFYFLAIAQPDALITLISPARRTSVIVSFLLGIYLFREKHVVAKALCILGIVAGVILLS